MKTITSYAVSHDMSLREAMRVIDQTTLRSAPVVDQNGTLVGTVSDGDIRRAILSGNGVDDSVRNVMTKEPVSIDAGYQSPEALRLLKRGGITILPVIDQQDQLVDVLIITSASELISVLDREEAGKPLKHVLVTGGGGFIGSILTELLLDRGYEVTVLDRFLYGKESLDSLKHERLHVVEGDVRHIEDITTSARDANAVVHLAEIVGDPASALDPVRTQEINYLGTRSVASVAKHFQINRFVYASSCSVYGASDGSELLDENSPLHPVSLYAKMKIASEQGLLEIQDESFQPTVFRLATVFGWSHRPRFDLVVNTLTAKAVREGKITIFGGDQWRPNVHARDVARSIIAALEAPLDKVQGEVFNIGVEDNNMTINEIGRIVNDVVEEAEVVIEERDVDKRNYRVSFDKLHRVLGPISMTTVAEGVREVRDALEQNESLEWDAPQHSNVAQLKNASQGKDER